MADKKGMNRIKEKLIAIKKKAEPFLTKRNQVILFAVTIVMAALSIADAALQIFPFPVSIAIYVLAAISFFSSCALWVRAIRLLVSVVFIPFTENNKIANMLIQDYQLRTVITALPGLGMNLIFAVFNAVIGIIDRSAWHGSLSAYYILLCAMRFISVMYAKRIYIDKKEMKAEQRELKVYKNCGIMLSVMSIALMGAVIMLVMGFGGKSYPEVVAIAVAAYTFYKFTMSIFNMVKARKENSLLLITLRYIGYSEALVAMLSLQTALLDAFGQGSKELIPIMNAATGAAVCLIALFLGIYMVHDAKKRAQAATTDYKGGTEHDSYLSCR